MELLEISCFLTAFCKLGGYVVGSNTLLSHKNRKVENKVAYF